MNELTNQQQRFVNEYIKCLNPKDAAIKAGYEKSKAKYRGENLLKQESVLLAIKTAISEQARSLQVNKAYIIQRLLNIIEFSLTQEDILDKDGNSTGKTKLRDTQSSLRALDFLCKHLGMAAQETVLNEQEPKITFIDNLDDKKI